MLSMYYGAKDADRIIIIAMGADSRSSRGNSRLPNESKGEKVGSSKGKVI